MAKTRGKQKHYVASFAVGGVVSAGVLTPSITATSLLDTLVNIPTPVVTAQH